MSRAVEMRISSVPEDADEITRRLDALQWAYRMTHQALIDLEKSIQDVGALRVISNIILERMREVTHG